jgi:predicted ester cyclase
VSEQNKILVRRAIEEVWNRGHFALVDELIVSDYIGHASTPASEVHGPAGYKRFYTLLRRRFPDIHFAIEDQIAEGDKVVTCWIASALNVDGSRKGEPTGKHTLLSGITVDRIAGGKIVECWTNAYDQGLLQQLGLLATPEQAGQGA